MNAGWAPLELLVLQPTPFCNLDCSYCYLPHRDDRRRMSEAVLQAALKAFLPPSGGAMSIVWHAGEPLTLAPTWYEAAFAQVEAFRPAALHVRHHFQTNSVLLDDRWHALIRRHDVQIGVSIDGPAFLHDARRRTRQGRGTHGLVMDRIHGLREAAIPFHVICVLTRQSLAHPDEIYDFFAALGSVQVGFNVEEIEAGSTRSSLDAPEVDALYRAFWRRMLVRWRLDTSGRPELREVKTVLAALRDPQFGTLHDNSQNRAGSIVSVAWNGDYTTWSPELLGVSHPRLGPVVFGNVLQDGRAHDDRYAMQAEIEAGVRRCRRECAYFDFCLGGAPANKLGEHGRFDGTETMFCRLTHKAVIDEVLLALEEDLAAAASRPRTGAWIEGRLT